jgi:hypothetical protein
MIKDFFKALMSDEVETVPFETQLKTLEVSGILPNADVSEETIISELKKMGFDKKDTENDPSLLLTVFGSSREIGEGIFEPNSRDVLHLNTQCVQESGIYTEVLSSLIDMTKGSLDLKDINEFLDLENFEAQIAFVHNGNPYKWALRVAEDNFDITLLTKLNNLLTDEKSEKNFYIQCDEETVIIIFTDTDIANSLNKTLDLGFELA